MPINFKSVERGEPGVAGGGRKKFYATAVSNGEAGLDEFTSLIERTSTVNGADILAVLYSFVENMMFELGKGNIVRLGDMGSFRVSISSESHEKEEDVKASSIKNARILFTPGKKLKKQLKSLEYKKA